MNKQTVIYTFSFTTVNRVGCRPTAEYDYCAFI